MLSSSSPAALAAPVYNVVDLGPTWLQGDVGLNNRGQVAFVSQGHLVRYSDGLGLETLSDRNFQDINIGINDRGQVAGQVRIPQMPYYVAFRYTDGVGIEILQPDEKSYSAGINDLGHVAVQSGMGLYLYTDAGGLTPLDSPSVLAQDINNAGEIVGTPAYVYRPGAGIEPLNQVAPGGRPNAISDTGFIAGGISGSERAFRIDPSGALTILSTHFARESLDVNNQGHVVGYAGNKFDHPTAFLFTDADGAQNLNTLIDPAARWKLERAVAINDWGQIAGTGLFNGHHRAFRLDPVNPIPEPTTLALLAVGLLPLARRRKGWGRN